MSSGDTNRLFFFQTHFEDISNLRQQLLFADLKNVDVLIFSCWCTKKPNWNGQFPASEQEIAQELKNIGFGFRQRRIEKASALKSAHNLQKEYLFCFSRSRDCKDILQLTKRNHSFDDLLNVFTSSAKRKYRHVEKYLRQERRYNATKKAWVREAAKIITRTHKYHSASSVKPYSTIIDSRISFNGKSIAFIKPWLYPLRSLLFPERRWRHYANVGQPWAHNNEDLFMIERRESYPHDNSDHPRLDPLPKKEGIVIHTLLFNDFEFLEPWLEHYRNEGVIHFLLYYNGPQLPESLYILKTENEDISVIHWPFTYAYRNSILGKPDYHHAQVCSFQHAQFYCARHNLGTHLLIIDVDEYIIGGKPLKEFANQPTPTEFINCWALNEDGEFGVNRTTKIKLGEVDFSSLVQKKQLKPIIPYSPILIHGKRDNHHVSPAHLLLHFGIQTNQNSRGTIFKPKGAYADTSDFISFEQIDADNDIRQIFEAFENRELEKNSETNG